MNKKIESAVNQQLKEEIYSAYLYMSLAAHYDEANFKGFAAWLQLQAKEELGHAMKFYKFITDRGGHVVLHAIEQPPTSFPEPAKAFVLAYEHEQKITGLISQLASLARDEQDAALEQFLQWFIQEQVEEEATTREVVEKLEAISGDVAGMLVLDEQMATRSTSE